MRQRKGHGEPMDVRRNRGQPRKSRRTSLAPLSMIQPAPFAAEFQQPVRHTEQIVLIVASVTAVGRARYRTAVSATFRESTK